MRSILGLWPLLLLGACATDPGPRSADELREHARGMNVMLVVLDAAKAVNIGSVSVATTSRP